jgi:hypothetical protein
MITIRRAQADDITSILRIEKKSFARDAWDREAFIDYLAQPGQSVFLVATINDKIVGTLWRPMARPAPRLIQSLSLLPTAATESRLRS